MKQRVILVGDYNRADFLYTAKLLHGEIDFYFIEFINQHSLQNREFAKYGQVLYWKDFRSAYDLLEKIQPAKILFYFIESFNHVALNVAARSKNIPTYHLEHGLRFTIDQFLKDDFDSRKPFDVKKKIVNLRFLFDRLANRNFFLRTVKESNEEGSEFLRLYYSVRKKNSIRATFEKIKNPLRLAGSYISFSPLIFSYHQKTESLPADYPVTYVGIPFFDHFIKWKSLTESGKSILFIDQPLHEKGLLGWTAELKTKFLSELVLFCSEIDRHLYIKPHPWNDRSVYEGLPAGAEVIGENWDAIIPKVDSVLGFSSTLLMPFMAMDHIACFTLEMHEKKTESPYSEFLIRSKACQPVTSFADLRGKILNREEWYKNQREHKDYFIENWMYRFDGQSSDRLRKALITDEAV